MIPLGILASSTKKDLTPSEPDEVGIVQVWDQTDPDATLSGPAVKQGNLLILTATQYTGWSGLPGTPQDNLHGTWHEIATVPIGDDGDTYMWYAENALPITSLEVYISGPSRDRVLRLVEVQGIAKTGALHRSNTQEDQESLNPDPALVEVGNSTPFVYGSLGTTIPNSGFELLSPEYTEIPPVHSSDTTRPMSIFSSYRIDTPGGNHGPSWGIPQGGTPAISSLITASFNPIGTI